MADPLGYRSNAQRTMGIAALLSHFARKGFDDGL
jgi:hypothetical protein